MNTNPLIVFAGDSLKLLNTPMYQVLIPIPEIVSLMPLLTLPIEEYVDRVALRNIYINPRTFLPAAKGEDYTWYLHNDTSFTTPYTIAELADMAQANQPIDIIGVNKTKQVIFKNLTLANFYPERTAIAIEIVREVLQSYYLQERPWMQPIISNAVNIRVPLHIANGVIEMLLYSSLNRDEEFAAHPTHLVRVVTKNKPGIVIQLLCDIRVYKFVNDQEKLCIPT